MKTAKQNSVSKIKATPDSMSVAIRVHLTLFDHSEHFLIMLNSCRDAFALGWKNNTRCNQCRELQTVLADKRVHAHTHTQMCVNDH